MPRRPSPLPPDLAGRAFSVSEAVAAGVPRGRLRGPDLVRPRQGARAHGVPATALEAARGVATAQVGTWAFSHVTAARLLGVPLPRRWASDERTDVIRLSDEAFPRDRAVRGHRGLERRRLTTVERLPVVDPVDTWADLATVLGVPWLVAAGDCLIGRDGIGLHHLRAVAAVPRRRGARRLRAAAELVRPGSASPMESRARVMFADYGLPEPELNGHVVEHGEWLGCVDFVWREERVIVEFEGDQHRTDRRQWQRDVDRVRHLEAAGWKVIRMTAADLTLEREGRFCAVLRQALRHGRMRAIG